MINRYASLKQGLVGAWCPSVSGSFGFRLPDLSRYGNHGTLTNMDPGTDWVLSGGKLALDFDGVDDYVSFQNTSALKPANVTIAANVLMRTTPSIDNQPFISWDGGSQDAYGFTVKNTGATTAQGFYFLNATTFLLFNTTNFSRWYSLIGSVGPTGMNFYVDGVLVVSNASITTISYAGFGTQRLNIGYGGGTIYPSFLIDDVRIYNRALTPQEIRLLYTGGRGVGLMPERIKHRRKTSAAATNRRRRLICGANC